ncbi:MAG: DsbA family protein [Defluviimonas denitrificans]
MKPTYLLAGAVALVALGGVWGMSRTATDPITLIASPAMAQEASVSSEAARVPDMVLGQEDAPVTMIEYASFTCSHCANFHDEAFAKLKTDYIDTGKVKFVYREVYFDRYGLLAAMIARDGGPEKYFKISDVLYETQRDWISAGDDKGIIDNLRKIGLKAGIDKDKIEATIAAFDTCTADIKACMETDNIAGAMVATYQANATADNIKGTPTIIINGETHSGEMSYEDLSKIIDAKLGS